MPYGEALWSVGTGSSAYGFTGENFDMSVALAFLWARYMQPNLGVFLSHDVWNGDNLRPRSMNGWNYVEQNPINNVDPSGKIPTRESIEKGQHSFSCRCGWIDWTHADEDNPLEFITAVRAEVPGGARDYKGVLASVHSFYGGFGVSQWAIVRKDLSFEKQNAVATGIYMEIEERFEEWQAGEIFGAPVGDILGHSSYSMEDLPSDLIAVYTALVEDKSVSREEQQRRIKPICGALDDPEADKAWSKQVLEVYEKSGLVYEKNYAWHPNLIVLVVPLMTVYP